ncbi:MAG: transposase family protein [Caldimicrobium sp.]
MYILTVTEVLTGWTEVRPIRNKAMVWRKQALEDILKAMPVPIGRIHSDNGSEFINAHVQRICRERGDRVYEVKAL